MKKVGQIFREAREKQGLSIDRVVAQTKLTPEFLRAIESDDYDRLPRGLYPQLYIREYARFLGLSEEKMVAIFRRDYRGQEEEPRKRFWLKLAPQRRWSRFLGGGVILIIFLAYLLYQYLNFVRPPRVEVNLIKQERGGFIIEGKTDPRASLKIDDQVVSLDSEGRFHHRLNRDRGKVRIEVESPAGRKRLIERELK